MSREAQILETTGCPSESEGASTTRQGRRMEVFEFARIVRGTLHPFIVVVGGPASGRTIRVEDGLVIGRASSCGVRIDEQGVSRKHAHFEKDPDGSIVLVDVGSTNGTLVNGAFTRRKTLHDGDVIVVGDTSVLKFSFADLVEENLLHSLYESSRRDPQTGTHNRRWFDELLPLEVERAARRGRPLTLLMIDIDRMKILNDLHGHVIGDQVLCAVASAVTATVRKPDAVARFGGEELAVILRDTDPAAAQALAERIRAAVEGTRVMHDLETLSVTVSIGAATTLRSITCDGLVGCADRALRAAKLSGRNRVEASVVR